MRQLALSALCLLLMPGAADAASVGTAGAANTRSTGTPPGGGSRVIEIGAQVVSNERIVTSNTGSVQIVFIDKTTLNIGPNAELVIDRFVFNPATAQGEMALSLTKGALRLVGGQATHTGGATVTTPAASIGIRGGIAQISHCPPGTGERCGPQGTQATNVFGRMTIASGGGTELITRPGFTSNIASAGAAPSPPVRASAAIIALGIAGTTSQGGQRGGARTPPSERTAQAGGLGAANSGVDARLSVPRQGQTAAGTVASAAPLNLSGGLVRSVNQGQQAAATNGTIAALLAPVVATPRDVVTPPVVVVPNNNVPPKAYTLVTTAGAGSNIPFLTASFATSGSVIVTPVFGYRSGGANADGSADSTSRAFQASLAINGAGAAQTSTLNVMTGVLFKSDNAGQVFAGGFRASSRGSSTDRIVAFARGSVTSSTQSGKSIALAPVATDATGIPTAAFPVTQNNESNTNNTAVLQAESAVQGVGTRLYTFDQTFSPTAAPAGLGDNHPATTLSGYAGGIARTTRFTQISATTANNSTGPAFIVTNATNSPGDISISLQSSSRVAADFAVRNLNATGAADEFSSARLGFGSFSASGSTRYRGTRGVYVDLTHFAARDRLISTNSGATEQDDSTINGTRSSTGGALVNANVFNNGQILSGFTPCACAYTQWGLWSLESVRSESSTGDAQTADRTGIAFWVAGTPSTFASMPTAGTATYLGHAIASVASTSAAGTAQYIASSPFGASVNFAARNATIGISSLDGAAYGGTVSFAPGAATFGGNIASTVAGRVMNLNGTLYQAGAASPVGEIGGGLTVQGTNYLASGIFLGAKR